MPLVSVVMVFHRDTPFLRPAIASVLGQTLRDLELVLVDNGTGLTPEALGELGRDRRVRWVRRPNNDGIPAGHNAGVAATQGEFIALLDYDDVALPARLERQVTRLRAEPRLGLVSSLAETIDESGRVTGREFSLIEENAQRAYTQFAAPVVTPAYAGRREVFLELPYRSEFPLAADFDFLARAAERFAMAAVPEVLLHYRQYRDQTTQQRAAAIQQSRCAIRLLTARRRAGRPEDLASLADLGRDVPTPAESCRRYAERCLTEGFSVLASYHARRMVALERSPRSFLAACALAGRAFAQARGQQKAVVTSFFLRGPVRALHLQPG